MKKIFLSVSAFLFLIVFGVLYGFLFKDWSREEDLQVLEVNNRKFNVEIADDMLEQARGLSGRDSLQENQGMLFLFPDFGKRSFWMVGMKFPLDIIWISGGRIVGILENLPPAANTNPELYYSPENVDKVLEINAGLSKKFGIKIGDAIMLR